VSPDVSETGERLSPRELELLVVFTCYRAAELLVDCLRSLSPQIRDVPRTQVAICENGTGEESVRLLREAIRSEGFGEWVSLKAIRPNRGFTGGNNAILRDVVAWPTPPRYVLLLNCDTIVRPGALAALHRFVEASPGVGIAGPRIVDGAGELQNTLFRDPSPRTELARTAGIGWLHRALGLPRFELEQDSHPGKGGWATFACAMIRGEVLQQIGLLDEGFFLYFDDADYCRRARAAGWTIARCDAAEVVHLEGRSNPVPEDTRLRRRRPRYYYVSRARYFGKHTGIAGLWCANLAWLLGRSASWLRERLTSAPTHVCEKEWRDVWIHALAPVRSSEPPETKIESRIVVEAGAARAS
jgi:hypothetical protein